MLGAYVWRDSFAALIRDARILRGVVDKMPACWPPRWPVKSDRVRSSEGTSTFIINLSLIGWNICYAIGVQLARSRSNYVFVTPLRFSGCLNETKIRNYI